MKTTELQISQEELIKGSLNKRRRRRYRGMGGPISPVPLDGEPYQDRIARATEREREHRRVRLPEGDGACAAEGCAVGSRFKTSFYHDKTLLCGADVEPGFLNTPAAHHLKALTGNDLMTTEHKGSSMSDLLRGDFNILVTCNSRLMVKLQGDAEAWARRLLWVEFNQPKAAKPIHGFDNWLLRNEGSGILNWMLEGAVRLLAVLDAHEPFPLTAEQRERVNKLLSESDAARTFILTGVERSAFPLDCVTATELFAAYLAFCDERGWSPLSQRAFAIKAKDLMVQIHRACPSKHVNREGAGSGQRGFQGVILKSSGGPEDDSRERGGADGPF